MALSEQLSEAEQIVLDDLSHGHTSRVIAERQGLSLHTVNAHKKNIFLKLNVKTTTAAVSAGFARGILR